MDLVQNWDRGVTLVGGALYALWKIGQAIRVRRNGNGDKLKSASTNHLVLSKLQEHENRITDLELWKAYETRRKRILGIGDADTD